MKSILEMGNEELSEYYIGLSGTRIHAMDCATSVAPAERPGPCDCQVEVVRNDLSVRGKLVRTVINVAAVPVAVVKDVVTLGGVATEQEKSYTAQKLEQIKEEAENE